MSACRERVNIVMLCQCMSAYYSVMMVSITIVISGMSLWKRDNCFFKDLDHL